MTPYQKHLSLLAKGRPPNLPGRWCDCGKPAFRKLAGGNGSECWDCYIKNHRVSSSTKYYHGGNNCAPPTDAEAYSKEEYRKLMSKYCGTVHRVVGKARMLV